MMDSSRERYGWSFGGLVNYEQISRVIMQLKIQLTLVCSVCLDALVESDPEVLEAWPPCQPSYRL